MHVVSQSIIRLDISEGLRDLEGGNMKHALPAEEAAPEWWWWVRLWACSKVCEPWPCTGPGPLLPP